MKIISFAAALLMLLSVPANSSPAFSHLSKSDGLSSLSANDVCFDNYGIVWIATRDGLNRYDGSSVRAFFQTYQDGEMTGNTFTRVCFDGKETIYLQSTGGIVAFDTRAEHFSTILPLEVGAIAFHEGALYAGIRNKVLVRDETSGEFDEFAVLEDGNMISGIAFRKDGTLLVGTDSNGLYQFNSDGAAEKLIPDGLIYEIIEDSKDELWACSWDKGLFRIGKNGVVNYRKGTIASDFVRCCCEDGNGDIWIGSIKGLDKFDRASESIRPYEPDSNSKNNLSDNSIWSIRKDSQGNLWVTTYFGGVNWFNPETGFFKVYRQSDSKDGRNGLESPVVSAFAEDSVSNIWIGTEGGLNYLDRHSGRITVFPKAPEHIKSLYLDEDRKELWICSDYDGLYCFNLTGIKKREFHSVPGCSDGLPHNRVRDILPFGDDSLIVATHGGVRIMSRTTGKCRPLLDREEEEINTEFVSDIYLDSKSNLWIVSRGSGLYRYNFENKSFDRYGTEHRESCYINSKYPNSVCEDKSGNIWVATKDNGINRYDPERNCFRNFVIKDLPPESSCVYCIEELPSDDNLILTTSSGFSVFNPLTGDVRHFNQDNGFPFCSSYENALLTASDGTVFIGSTEGLTFFGQKDISPSGKVSRIIPSRILLDNEPYDAGMAPHFIQSVTLKHSVSQMSIEFALTNFIPTNQITLEYLIEGISKQWTQMKAGQQINFTKLPPGKYTLYVRSVNQQDEALCVPAKIRITVLTPWYRSIPAFLIYASLLFLIIFSFVKDYNARIRMHETEALNKSRINFFTSISHDIRTPLTIITSQMEDLMQRNEYSPSTWNKLLAVYKNGLQLNNLIDELMEFSRQEKGGIKIKAAPHNLSFFVGEFCLLFEEYARSKGIELSCLKDTERLEVWFDVKQMQKVLSNILSNAFKYTESSGKICVRVYSKGSEAVISISDTGKGIAAKDLNNIFGLFYRVEDDDNEQISGTGIGLSIAKNIIEHHHGTISVDSELGKGTVFTIKLPLGYSHFTPDQIAVEDTHVNDELSTVAEQEDEDVKNSAPKGKSILIVEDNESVRKMLSELFSPYYNVLCAQNGSEGWDMVRKESPDIVLSDVMMPLISGTQLCKKIKGDPDTCHIPVVLLTARVSVDQNIEGLLMGADDYIAKPFNNRLLLSRCNNLVNSRIMLQEKFTRSPQASVRMLATNTMDKTFLDKVLQIVEDHIDDSEFDVAEFSTEIGVSRTSLFSKIKSVTGQTPKDFVMTIRLKKAATLLKEKPEMSIAEISERTGFSSQSHFSQRFKAVYHISPLNYRKG